ncbi:MAG: folylpolyglutamate synthase/dihydrofolate synthase family protein [Bacteroidota bacterium]
MTYQDAETFLFNELQSFQEKGKIAYNSTLENAFALSEMLDNPHLKFKSVHVAGTNGKGSVSHMIAAGLQANGYKVGLYTSPHYKTYRERIKINGQLISEADVTQFIKTYRAQILKMKPSFFEITCALAFAHFAKEKVDVAVIEVGLGGRLDSTNIIRPLLSVITNISFDHQSILGNTIEKIAWEKAGIFKQNIPVVIGENQIETLPVYAHKAKEVNAILHYTEDDTAYNCNEKINHTKCSFHVVDRDWNFDIETPMSSPFQLKNLRTSLYALYHLRDHFNLMTDKIAQGIKNLNTLTYYIGRWSTLRNNPLVILDSAHNVAGVTYLVQEVQKMFYTRLRLVWGASKGKDIDEILSLLPKDATYYFCNAQNTRAIEGEELREKAQEYQLEGYSYRTVKVAYQVALAESSETDLIVVAGSVFVVSEVL